MGEIAASGLQVRSGRRRLFGSSGSSDRYHELLAMINRQQARPCRVPDLRWLLAAIDSHPA